MSTAAATRVALLLLCWNLAVPCHAGSEPQTDRATVHVRIVDHSGQVIQGPVVAAFRSTQGKDLARRFSSGQATAVPFGVYKLRVYAKGFWSSEREVRVFQPEVWVVVALELGMGRLEGGLMTYSLTGTVEGVKPDSSEVVWLRLSGMYSSLIMDVQATESGDFNVAGIPQGKYLLAASRAGRIIDVKEVTIPSSEQVILRVPPEAGGAGKLK